MRHCKDWLNDAMMIPEAKKAPLAVNRSVLKLKVFRKSQISGVFFWIFSLNKDVLQLASSRSFEKIKMFGSEIGNNII